MTLLELPVVFQIFCTYTAQSYSLARAILTSIPYFSLSPSTPSYVHYNLFSFHLCVVHFVPDRPHSRIRKTPSRVRHVSSRVRQRALVVSVGWLQSQRQHVTRCLSDAKLRLRLDGCDNDINVRQMSIDR